MEILSLGLVVLGCVFLAWFVVAAVFANSLIRTGKYANVNVNILPLVLGAFLVFLGVGLGLLTW